MKRLFANDTGKGQVFSNSKLDILTKTSIPITILFYGSIWTAFLVLNYFYSQKSFVNAVIVYISALFFWTLFEYLMHRYVFHFINEKIWSKKFHYAVHGIHHEYPRDKERLFMPPLPGFALIFLLTGFFYLFFSNSVFIFMAGFLNGWALYVSIHYIIHVYQPVKPVKILWTHHAKHHYKDGNKAFGVSSPLWDYVFGTMPK